MTDQTSARQRGSSKGGRRKEWRGRLVNPPVERASTILFDSVAELRGGRPGLGELSLRPAGHRDPLGACPKR